MGDYFNHWLKLPLAGPACPHLLHHGFRTDAKWKFIWPGYAKTRVLKWIVERCQGRGNAVNTDRKVPDFDDLDWKGREASAARKSSASARSTEWSGKRELKTSKMNCSSWLGALAARACCPNVRRSGVP